MKKQDIQVTSNSSFSNNKEISFFIPFRNEESALRSTVEIILEVAKNHTTNFEIILVNDGSTDQSPQIAQDLANNANIHFLDLKKNFGFGMAYLEGFKSCKMAYAMYLTADGDVERNELTEILKTWNGQSPLIQSAKNPHTRKLFRYGLSKFYTFLIQVFSGTNWPYYNGFNILPVVEKEKLSLKDFGFCTQAHLLLQVLRDRNDIQFVATESKFNDEGSKALTFANFRSAFRFFLYLVKYQ